MKNFFFPFTVFAVTLAICFSVTVFFGSFGSVQAQTSVTKTGGGSVSATATPQPTATPQSTATPQPTATIIPNYVTTDTTQNITGTKTINANMFFGTNFGIADVLGQFGIIFTASPMTPDAPEILLPSSSNSIHIMEYGDYSADFQNCSAGASASTNPLLCIHSTDGSSTTKWIDFKHNQTNGVIAVGLGGLILPGMVATSGTAPAVSNTTAASCGSTSATLAGNDTVGVITVGATAGTSCTITFVVAAPTRRVCDCNNETTVANLCSAVPLTTTTSKVVGTFVAGDNVSYQCGAY